MMSQSWKKQFIILWSGQSVSILTSAIIQMSLVWYLTSKTESAAIMSIGTLMGFIPRAIIGPFAGVIIDRFSRKKIMLIADLFIAIISLIPVFYGFFAELPIWIIMLVLFCRSLGSAFHTPALQAATPLIVPKESLTQYAGFAQGFDSLSHLISPAIASILFNLLDLNVLMLIDVFGALFAVLTLSFVIIPNTPGIERHKRAGYMSEFQEGLAIVKTEPAVVFIIVVSCIYSIIYSPIGTYYPLITITHFGGSIGDSALAETVLSLGSLCGAFGLGLVGKKINKMRSFFLSIFTYGACLIVIGAVPKSLFIVFVIASAILGASIPFYSSIRTSIIQAKFEPQYLGRIFAMTSAMTTFTTPIGLICAGIFAEKVGIGNWFFFSGIASVVLAAISLIKLRGVSKKEQPNEN